MRRAHGIAILVLVSILAIACGPRTSTAGARGDTNLITSEEVDAAGHQNAFLLVQSLRPQWLRVRGASSMGARDAIRVYLDGSLLGGPEHLRQISTQSISSLRYLDGLEASQRWGLDHGAGAIVVTTRGG